MRTKRRVFLPPAGPDGKKPVPQHANTPQPRDDEGEEEDDSSDDEPLVRISDAAHMLKVSENTVRSYIKQGLLDRRLLGTRTVRTTRSSLNRLMGQSVE